MSSEAEIVPMKRSPIGMTPRGVQFENLEDLARFCSMLAKTDLCPAGYTPEKCVVAIQFGLEAGITALQGLQNVGVIGGRAFLFGDAPLALCRVHPDWQRGVFKEWMEGEGDDRIAYCRVGRQGEEAITQPFSWKEAKQAGLTNGPVWKLYPNRMLKFKARNWALRDMYGDALKGFISEDEAREIAAAESTERVALGGMESFVGAPGVIDVTPEKAVKSAYRERAVENAKGVAETVKEKKARAVSKLKTPEKAPPADPAMARLERQEAAAEAKAAPKADRETIVRLRTYHPRMKALGLKWQDHVKADPHSLTDEQLEALMSRLEGVMTDALFEQQAQNGPEDEHPEREPGQDD